MSGPKRTRYSISQRLYQQQKREQQLRRQKQIGEIEDKLKNCNQLKDELLNKYPQHSQYLIEIVQDMNRDVTDSLRGDLRNSWRLIKNLERYLNSQKNEIIVQDKEAIKQEKINKMIGSVKSIEDDYPEIINEGIRQRIDLFSKSIEANPDNINTINEIKQFREQINKKVEELEIEKQNRQHVKDTFVDALGGKLEDDGSGGVVISGDIDGVPITVKLNDVNNEINLDTPTDGSCRKGLNALQEKLENANISIGEIHILKTGQRINTTQVVKKNKRLDA